MKDISKSTRELMIKEPFYGFFFLQLNKFYDNRIPTACVRRVGINTELAINKEFWKELTTEQRLGILKHEILHICFCHLTLMTTFKNLKLFNIAADIEVNQYIDSTWLPKDCMNLHTFPELKLEPKKGTKYYYEKLLENLESDNPNPLLQQLMSQAGNMPSGNQMGTHEWKDFEDLSDAEKDLIEKQRGHLLKQTANEIKTKGQGFTPGELVSILDALFKIEPPIYNWKAAFRRLLGFSYEIFTKKSQRKRSKRFDDAAGIKIKRKAKIIFAIDTSGSVSNEELLEAFSELYHVWKAGVQVTIIECDADIQKIYEYKGKWDGKIHGRGGTEFDPVIKYYNTHPEYSKLIYFTDGGAYAHEKTSKGIIWIISSNGEVNDSLKGQIIKIKK